MSSVRAVDAYADNLRQTTDIRDHLPRLLDVARGTVVELGVRGGVSTSALLVGVERHGGDVWSVDVDSGCSGLYDEHPQWHFVQADSRDPGAVVAAGMRDPVDVLFVDTEHTYEQVRGELEAWFPFVREGAVLLFHDTETFPEVRHAVRDFARRMGFAYEFHPGSNGLGVVTATRRSRPAGRLERSATQARYHLRRARAGARARRSAYFALRPRLKRALGRALGRGATT